MDRYSILLGKEPKEEPVKQNFKKYGKEYGLCRCCANFDNGDNFKGRIPECRECNWLLPGTEDHWIPSYKLTDSYNLTNYIEKFGGRGRGDLRM